MASTEPIALVMGELAPRWLKRIPDAVNFTAISEKFH
jgi:hypothetical protein